MNLPAWQRLCSSSELSLKNTLHSGQAFSWLRHRDGVWVSPLWDFVVAVREDRERDEVAFRVIAAADEEDESVACERATRVRRYFRCADAEQTSLSQLYEAWSAADGNFRLRAQAMPGLRLLQQDPCECLFSFVCSQNNNVKRIAGMLRRFREAFGAQIISTEALLHKLELPPEPDDDWPPAFHRFPSLDDIQRLATDERLRQLGFGYRAGYVVGTAAAIAAHGGADWLAAMRSADRATVRKQLLALPGIGPKVADCIMLFCLEHLDVVPVDTHVRHIYLRDYRPPTDRQSPRSLTAAMYQEITAFFRDKFGDRAGWAHSVLFSADLNSPDQPAIESTDNSPPAEKSKSKKSESTRKTPPPGKSQAAPQSPKKKKRVS